jgi:hypothetical protein
LLTHRLFTHAYYPVTAAKLATHILDTSRTTSKFLSPHPERRNTSVLDAVVEKGVGEASKTIGVC